MYVGIVILLIGLALLGYTLSRILGGISPEKTRQWYGLALVGVFLSLGGLVLTLRGMRAPTAGIQPPGSATQVVEKPKPPAYIPPPIVQPEPMSLSEDRPPKGIPDMFWRQELATRRALKEDPNGKLYGKEDFNYFNSQIKLMSNGFNQLITETITGTPPPEKANMPKIEFWNNFNFNLGVYATNLKGRAGSKNGPGTAAVKSRLYQIADLMIKMEAVYHNAIRDNKEPDYQYIGELQNRIELLTKEVEEIQKKEGY